MGADQITMAHSLALSYHAVSPDWPAELSIEPELLAEHVGHLLRRGYRPVTFAEIARGDGEGKTVAVTFDDGYRSVFERALPILGELGVPATVFVPTAFVGSGRPMTWEGIDRWLGTRFEPELQPLDWDQLERLRAAGWEIASHTRHHPRLTELADDDLADELGGSRADLSDALDAPCTTLAFPYGDHDARVAAAARAAGYSAAATLTRIRDASGFCFPRVGAYAIDNRWRFRMKTSPLVGRIRGTPLGQLVEDVR